MAIRDKKKADWERIDIRIEGGGINYGLLPIEAGVLLGLGGKSFHAAINQMLINKKIISQSNDEFKIDSVVMNILRSQKYTDHEKKLEISKRANQLVHDYEYMFLLTIFPAGNFVLSEVDLSFVQEYIGKSIASRLPGYSGAKTKQYYIELMEFISDKDGWQGKESRKNWIIIKKALDSDPRLSINEIFSYISQN